MPRVPGLFCASEFEQMFVREGARADRSRHAFCVVVFIVEGDVEDCCELAEMLIERARGADVVGRLDSERLAVLLPYTTGKGAWVFADEVLLQVARKNIKCDCEVFAYPGEGSDDHDGTAREPIEAGRQNAVPRPVEVDGNGAPIREPVTGEESERGKEVQDRALSQSPADGLSAVVSRRLSRPVRDLSTCFVEPLSLRKRALDVVVSGLLLVLLSPLFLLVAIAIKLMSPGPVIFKQDRAGLGGKPFTFYKFRSMRIGAEAAKEDLRDQNEKDGPIFKIENDPRLTPIGRFLRSTSLDELPQLWNVFKGDMSLIGPRPPTLDEVPNYEPWQRHRLDLKGGLTCIWQVSGRSEIGFQDWVRMDIRYAQTRSARMDLGLLARTLGAVVSRRGAY